MSTLFKVASIWIDVRCLNESIIDVISVPNGRVLCLVHCQRMLWNRNLFDPRVHMGFRMRWPLCRCIDRTHRQPPDIHSTIDELCIYSIHLFHNWDRFRCRWRPIAPIWKCCERVCRCRQWLRWLLHANRSGRTAWWIVVAFRLISDVIGGSLPE